jgi:hypothetical protein
MSLTAYQCSARYWITVIVPGTDSLSAVSTATNRDVVGHAVVAFKLRRGTAATTARTHR